MTQASTTSSPPPMNSQKSLATQTSNLLLMIYIRHTAPCPSCATRWDDWRSWE